MYDLCDGWDPNDLFDDYALEDWAEANGFVREEAAVTANYWSRNS